MFGLKPGKIWLAIIIVAIIAVPIALWQFSGLVEDGKQLLKKGLELVTKDTGPRIEIESSMIQTLDVKDMSVLYVCSAYMEDFAVEQQKKGGISSFFGNNDRKLIVIEKQECFYQIQLDSVKYIKNDDDNTVYVEIPEPEYVAFNKYEEVIADDNDFWRNFDHTPVGTRAKGKIRKSFCSEQNLNAAKQNAANSITKILEQMVGDNYKIVVVNSLLVQKREVAI